MLAQVCLVATSMVVACGVIGCVGTKILNEAKVVNSWIGKTPPALEKAWGSPTKTAPGPGGFMISEQHGPVTITKPDPNVHSTLTYRLTSGTTYKSSDGKNSFTPDSSGTTTEYQFAVDNKGKIRSWRSTAFSNSSSAP